MSKRIPASRRLLAAAALAAVPALAPAGASYAADTIVASDDVTARPGAANQISAGLFAKNATGESNFSGDGAAYMEFSIPKATYPVGFRSATLTMVTNGMYFTQISGTTFESYNPQMNFRVFGLQDSNPNEDFVETTLRGSGWSATTGPAATTAVNVGPLSTNNNPPQTSSPDFFGVFRNGFTANPRPTNTVSYTANPAWAAVNLGLVAVADANAGGVDEYTYSYPSATTSVQGANVSDGVPDASQSNMPGTPVNANLTYEVSDFINTYNSNDRATFVLWRATPGNGGASTFLHDPTLTVDPGIPIFWDTDGATPGSGGAAPAGTWDAAAANFNTDSTGGAGGTLAPLVTGGDNVVFGAGGDAIGTYTVTLSGARKAFQVTIEEGNVTLAAGGAGDTLATRVVNVAAGASGTIGAVLTGAGTFAKTGAGPLTLTAANTYTGGTTVNAGTLIAAHVNAFNSGALTVNAGGTARAQAGLPTALTVTTLTTTGTGQLDLTNNDLVVKSSTLAAVQAQVASGFNGGLWNGPGVNSATAAADANGVTALGYADNAELQLATFSGVPVTATDVLVKFTYYGDADLSGQVTLDDFGQFLNGFQNQTTATQTWLNGDFDYSGLVTLDDFGQFLHGFQNQGGPLSALSEAVADASGVSSSDRAFMQAAIAAVPEPGTLGVPALAGVGLLGRRSRRRR